MKASQSSGDPQLSIIIVTFNSSDCIAACLQSVRDTAAHLLPEVIVVDNRSSDHTPDIVRREFPEVSLQVQEINRGFGAGCNAGMRLARGEFFLLLNSDAELLPGAAETLLNVLLSSPEVGEAGPCLLNSDHTLQQSIGRDVGFAGELYQKCFVNLWERRRNPLAGFYLQRVHARAREADWLKGACVLLRRRAVFDAGLFDETFFMYLEDADLSLRLRRSGWKVWYTPDARVIHHGGRSVASDRHRNALEFRRSQLHFFQKHYGKTGLQSMRAYLLLKTATSYALGWIARTLGVAADSREQVLKETFRLIRDFR